MNPYQPNPYQPPQDPSQAPVAPAERTQLYDIARFQRGINMVVLPYMGTAFLMQSLGKLPLGRLLLGLVLIGVIVAGAVYAVRMASALYNTGIAVICAVLLLIPFVGLGVLLILNVCATARLRAAGINVGFLGADPDEVKRRLGL
ncbi:MAG: hypothetical protein QM820_63430 [Minicystis sp.]